ncbi:ADP-ribosylglycohydrolase family protein [Aspergillus stella-maris]|uniref:ADP-ribosylglycohydrolase family protein n=1 Tax=Aspergillus stella-maris TaxID=1810926 RepID=UPI003CCD2B57
MKSKIEIVKSRIKGSVFGVAVVDALGGPVEFQPRGSFEPVSDFQYNFNFDVPPGTWTDDTSMTLCLAKALIDSQGRFVVQAAIHNYVKWHDNGYLSATGHCFDIGFCTAQALRTWQKYFIRNPGIQKDDPAGHEAGQSAIDQALKREKYCGNGSLMRVSPIGLVYFRDINQALENAAASSDVTHPYPTCAECCEIYTKLIVRAMNNATKEDLAAEVAATMFRDSKIKDRLLRYKSLQDWQATPEHDIDSLGYVLSTLEAALWSFFTTSTFESGALRAVNLGCDADTVGAVYGGLAGAFYGMGEIPSRWVEALQKKEVIEEIASGLASLGQ